MTLFSPLYFGFSCPTISTHYTHIDGLSIALTDILNGISNEEVSWEIVSSCLIAILNVRHPAPQVKSLKALDLVNPELVSIVQELITEECERSGFNKPEVLQPILKYLSQG